jgi:hypothetical protein
MSMPAMNEDSQIVVPEAFVALFQSPEDHARATTPSRRHRAS